MVNSKRIEKWFSQLAVVGTDAGGGFTRLAFSDSDWQVRDIVIELMQNAGLTVRFDAFGNIIGRREGKNPDAPVVMLGSHTDSVPNGGNFDGVLGVLAAIEAVQCMQESGEENYHPIEVVVFMAEESSRFGYATLGSKVFCGKISLENLESYKDKQGISLAQEMRLRGLVPEKIAQACYTGEIKSFLELHIEQGKALELTGHQIGVVTGIAAPTRLRLMVTGMADHSGATPMNMRQDALTAAAEIILQVEALATAELQNGVVGTTGIVKAEPGVMNVIPGRVELGIDIRGISSDSKHRVIDNLVAAVDSIKDRRGVGVEIVTLTDDTPVQISGEMIDFLDDICKQFPYPTMRMPSGAGHDAMHIAAIAETGMLFIPCRGGISHNPGEWASIDDIVAGTEIVLAAVRKLASQEFSWQK
ncbi:Zn-dependent hydrolase [Anaerosporomusa subterranea]|uniref:Zn-dependent hydrolase n=1 Tax=Anaerosporomusa subterranea TaxID=1794912 RepID=A0A154BVR7_ANASB|nr:Zn-dependent hydrolase [Anaerosporomusa subterranea]KYZ78032.1 Zn-dependent hydrolase [Anaerosporomusa subterranea]